jgi:hypothetical protein
VHASTPVKPPVKTAPSARRGTSRTGPQPWPAVRGGPGADPPGGMATQRSPRSAPRQSPGPAALLEPYARAQRTSPAQPIPCATTRSVHTAVPPVDTPLQTLPWRDAAARPQTPTTAPQAVGSRARPAPNGSGAVVQRRRTFKTQDLGH